MNKAKKIIIIVIVVASIILAAILTELFIMINKDKEVSNNVTGNTETQNKIENGQNQNTFVPNSNEQIGQNTVGGGTVTQVPITSTAYYYNQLNNTGKVIYDKLRVEKDKLKTGNYIFDFESSFNTLLHTDNGSSELNKAFQSAIDAFMYDQPDLFYIDTTKINLITQYKSVGGINTYYTTIEPRAEQNYLKAEFPSQEQVEKAQGYVKYMVDQVIVQTSKDSVYQKVKKIHDWIISYVEYDKDNTSKNASNIYGALLEKKANCEGYSKLYKYLLEQVGVSCVLASGTVDSTEAKKESHIWNYVELNSKWYAVDVTWDDPILANGGTLTDDIMNKYFLKGSETLKKDHTEVNTFSKDGMKFKFPEISEQDY